MLRALQLSSRLRPLQVTTERVLSVIAPAKIQLHSEEAVRSRQSIHAKPWVLATAACFTILVVEACTPSDVAECMPPKRMQALDMPRDDQLAALRIYAGHEETRVSTAWCRQFFKAYHPGTVYAKTDGKEAALKQQLRLLCVQNTIGVEQGEHHLVLAGALLTDDVIPQVHLPVEAAQAEHVLPSSDYLPNYADYPLGAVPPAGPVLPLPEELPPLQATTTFMQSPAGLAFASQELLNPIAMAAAITPGSTPLGVAGTSAQHAEAAAASADIVMMSQGVPLVLDPTIHSHVATSARFCRMIEVLKDQRGRDFQDACMRGARSGTTVNYLVRTHASLCA
jgi:hypothetical protein